MKKRQIILILIGIIFISNASLVFGYWASGVLGSQDIASAYIEIGDWNTSVIEDEEDLVEFLSGEGDPTGDYVLTDDIDLTDNPDNVFEPIEDFSGNFDGNGNTITGFDIIDEETDFTGIFVTNTGTISNLVVEDVNISQYDNNNANNQDEVTYVGVLIGQNEGTVENVQVTSSTIIAENDSSTSWFSDSSLDVFAGGLVGYNGVNGVIKNSYSHADLYMETDLYAGFISTTTSNTYAGGLVGYNEGEISQSYNTGIVSSVVNDTSSSWGSSNANNYAGGIVGYNTSTGNVHDVFATGNITIDSDHSDYVGYVVGYNLGTVSNLFRLNTQTYSPSSATLFNSTTATTISNLQSSTYLTNNLGFDFINIWQEVTNDYPVIQN
ncbi:hypothetical protein KHQ89_03660 [Mycoplasmatota bacterium]|nr:hypothetical protein KHQ89_03660 [Mycoplasmatota bacterium]